MKPEKSHEEGVFENLSVCICLILAHINIFKLKLTPKNRLFGDVQQN